MPWAATRPSSTPCSARKSGPASRSGLTWRPSGWTAPGSPWCSSPATTTPTTSTSRSQPASTAQNPTARAWASPGHCRSLGWESRGRRPGQPPREVSEDAFREEIDYLADQARDPNRTIFLIHCPPYGSGLDTAPVLDQNLRLQASAGDLMRGPVGSTGVLEAVQQVRPLLSLHGHIHESGGEKKIGPTLCVKPGSEAGSGIVRGYLIDVGSDGIERSFRVEG